MIQTSGQASPSSSAGTATSMPDADQERPGQPGEVLHGDRDQQPPQRAGWCGRSSSPSSRRERPRRKMPAPAVSSSASSVATPRQFSRAVGAVAGRTASARSRQASASSLLLRRAGPGRPGTSASRSRVPADGGDPAALPAAPPGRPAARWRRGGRPPAPSSAASTSRSARSTSASVCTSRADSGSSRTSTDGRPEHGPGQRQPLPLAAGQRQPLLADPGVQAPGQVVHELGLRHPQRLGDVVVGGVRAAQRDVLPDAHREQRRVLERGRDHGCAAGPAAGRGRRRRRA